MLIKHLLNYLFFPIRLNMADGDGGGDPPAGDPPPGGEEIGAPGVGDPKDVDPPAGLAKPEGLEDSFWDQEKAEVRLDALIKSFSDTRAKIHETEENVRQRVIAEMQQQRPGSPDEYTISDLGIDPPEGYEFKFAEDDPMLKTWQEIAFQNNLSNDQFMEGVRTWITSNMQARPDAEQEILKLGENGAERIQRIDLLLNKHLEQNEVDAIADFALSADGVQIIEKLFDGITKSKLPDIDNLDTGKEKLTLAELQEMQRDPRYTGRGRARDPAYIAMVEKGFAKLYPGKAKVS